MKSNLSNVSDGHLLRGGLPSNGHQANESPGGHDPLEDLDGIAKNHCLLLGLVAITYLINNFVHKKEIPIPEALVTVCIGALAGAATLILPSERHDVQKLESMSVTEFLGAFIAPIIFAEGYGLKSRQFFNNLPRILTHAVLGTLLSAIVVGAGIFYFQPSAINITFAECLTFGALISATDPVTTLAIFKEQNMIDNGLGYLYYTVLGESILNDAVGITLFTAFGNLVQEDRTLSLDSVRLLTTDFFMNFFVSLAIGVAGGMLSAFLLKLAEFRAPDEEDAQFNVPELSTVLLLAYVPFLLAEALNFSGIVAVMFAGISMRHYAHYNMTVVTRKAFLPVTELLANLCETYVFLLLGIGIIMLGNSWSTGTVALICWAALFCIIGRALHVYPFSFILNKCSSCHSLNIQEQTMVVYAGLRGAVAFVCALCFPTSATHNHRGLFLSVTMVLAVASMVVFGWPTKAVLRCLKIQAGDDMGNVVGSLEKPPGIAEQLNRQIATVLMSTKAIAERDVSKQKAVAKWSQRHFKAHVNSRSMSGMRYPSICSLDTGSPNGSQVSMFYESGGSGGAPSLYRADNAIHGIVPTLVQPAHCVSAPGSFEKGRSWN
jgi:sodium/hydrogen exchanger 8